MHPCDQNLEQPPQQEIKREMETQAHEVDFVDDDTVAGMHHLPYSERKTSSPYRQSAKPPTTVTSDLDED